MSGENKKIDIEIQEALQGGNGPKVARFALASLSAIPVVGGIIGGVGSSWSEREQGKLNDLLATWLKLQEEEIKEIGKTIVEVISRLDGEDERVKKRVESPEYLSIVKKCFRDWSAAESEYKRVMVRNLLTNAGSTEICSDDVIMLFVSWIEKYSEQHFKVVSAVYNNEGITRKQIWGKVDGEEVREDSAKADLFKTIIQDLTLGHLIRQVRETDYDGNFIKRSKGKSNTSRVMKSTFDDYDGYELTGLGNWLVHYTMNEVVPKIGTSE